MARRRKKLPFYEQVEVTDLAADGKALARIDDLVVFIDGAVPGDIADVKVYKKKKNYQVGRAVTIHKFSDRRTDPICSHFGICGGCKWQNIPYEDQLRHKQSQIGEQLSRIAKVQLSEISPILASENTEYYRNKLEYTFSNRRWLTADEMETPDEDKQLNALGFHIPGKFDKVVDVEHCYLQDEPSNKIRLAVKKYALENSLEFFDLRQQTGFLRNLIIRNTDSGNVMVILVIYKEDEIARTTLLDFLARDFPEIVSLSYIINSKPNDSVADQEVVQYCGEDHIVEEMEGLKFKIGPKSFYQTNSRQAFNLYKITREFAQLTGKEIVYDLYTGTGTIAIFVASQAAKVIGIEYVPEAIEYANVNSEQNGIDNTLFFAGDMKDVLSYDFINEHGKPDVIILDPPRAGVHEKVITQMLFADPKRIVYVSCNPSTQARDIALLAEKYKIMKIQPVDMFPHTHHVENVVLLERI